MKAFFTVLATFGVWLLFVSVVAAQGGMKFNQNDKVPMNTPESVRRAIDDLSKTFGDKYPKGAEYLQRLGEIEKKLNTKKNDQKYQAEVRAEFDKFRREAMLANPLLDFDKIVVVRRKGLCAPTLNAYSNNEISKKNGWDNDLAVVSNLRSETPKIEKFYTPPGTRPMRDLKLHWDGKRVLFSSIDDQTGKWGVYEVNIDGTGLKLLTPTNMPDVDFFDATYLPCGDIVTGSTAGIQGLPCENGRLAMVNLYRVNPKTQGIRQLTFEQDSDWHPTMLQDGRVMYLRWEYVDIMHYFSRILFTMNPDGTKQIELYGSGSYFPTAFKFARPFPDSHEIVGIVSGHHSRPETGRLCIIDPTVGRKYPMRFRPKDKEWGQQGTTIDILPDILPAEKTGFIQEIPGFGKDVVGNVVDNQADGLKYNFIHPHPIGKNYILVSCQITGSPEYGLYLVDRFDNMTEIARLKDGDGIFEPIPLTETPTPRTIPDQVELDKKTANVFLTDVYYGPGLKDVPRGTVKNLRVFAYHYAYWQRGGHESVGIQSSWDVKRLLGTVPVEDDGSAMFEIPANTPVALQPLDEKGRAVQLMRSWIVGMPGENVSCTGCHENLLEATPSVRTKAAHRGVSPITPFLGGVRPIAFETEIYEPVVRKFCIGCHDGTKTDRPAFTDAKKAYDTINAYVHRGGPETDMDILKPYEFHASTSELVRMLEKGHQGVQLDKEAWERIYLWIDMNAPWRGKWDHPELAKRRIELSKLYAGIDDDPEDEYDKLLKHYADSPKPEFVKPAEVPKPSDTLTAANWPFDVAKAAEMQAKLFDGSERTKLIPLADNVTLRLTKIPAGEFVMGNLNGAPDEYPRSVQKIEKPFWIGVTEITNQQYEAYDPDHDTRYLDEDGKDHTTPGYIANHPDQPVARISWNEAKKFCDWLGGQLKMNVDLPTEAQWDWAARAGSAEQFPWGNLEADWSKFANCADAGTRFRYSKWEFGSAIHIRNPYPADWVYPLRDDRFTDSWFVVDYVAQSKPNVWGLYDMVGNVSEWTTSDYPHGESGRKIARGGSWAERPKVSGNSVKFPYLPYQKVYNVGFRIVVNE